jgi:hypothetical protein
MNSTEPVLARQLLFVNSRRLGSFAQKIYLMEERKLALSFFDTKRAWIGPNDSLPFGHHTLFHTSGKLIDTTGDYSTMSKATTSLHKVCVHKQSTFPRVILRSLFMTVKRYSRPSSRRAAGGGGSGEGGSHDHPAEKKSAAAAAAADCVDGAVVDERPRQRRRRCRGGGIINWIINHLPCELHLPGYRFCGPGTRLHKRLRLGQQGVNQLDELCKAHDIAYSAASGGDDVSSALNLADQELRRDPNVPLKERLAARLVAGVMKMKIALENH